MRYYSVLILLAISLLFVGKAGAENIGFSEETAQRIVVELEVCKTLQEQTELYKESNSELEKQVQLLEKVVELQKQELAISQTVIKNQKEMMEAQGKAYEDVLKASKPNLFKKLIDSVGLVGAGIVIGLIIL